MNENLARAIQHLQSRGVPRHTALGMVGSLMGESGHNLDVNAAGDKDKRTGVKMAYGVGQWWPDRQRNFHRAMGKPIRGSSLNEQLDFVLWELNNTEASAGKHVFGASTPMAAADAFTRYFERPKHKDAEAHKRAANAAQLAGMKMPTNIPMQSPVDAMRGITPNQSPTAQTAEQALMPFMDSGGTSYARSRGVNFGKLFGGEAAQPDSISADYDSNDIMGSMFRALNESVKRALLG